MKQMPLSNVRRNSFEGVISISFQLLSQADNNLWDEQRLRVARVLCACVTEKVMSVQMSDDWSKAPHTDVTRDFNCDQEPLLSAVCTVACQ